MASVTSRLRTRLDSLWKALLDYEKMDKILLQHGAIPDQFLKANDIRLIAHTFDRADNDSAYLSCDPPILFKPLPQSTIDSHPIGSEPITTVFTAVSTADSSADSSEDSSEMAFKDYVAPDDDDGDVYHSSSSPMACATYLAHGYLGNWVFGGFPRKNFSEDTLVPIQSLAELSGITQVR